MAEDQALGGLAQTLMTIQEKRGALYMNDVAPFLVQRWDLRSDELRAQNEETLHFVATLLNYDPQQLQHLLSNCAIIRSSHEPHAHTARSSLRVTEMQSSFDF